MGTIGGVYVPDNLMPQLAAPPAARPGMLDLVSDAAQATFGQVRYGVPYAVEKALGTADAADDQFYSQGLAAHQSTITPASVSDLTSGKVGFGRFVAENLATSLPYMAGGAAGAIGGGLVAGPVGAVAGAIAGGTPQFVGSNVDRAVTEQGTLDQGAAVRSLAVAPVQSAADAAIGMFLPGAGKLFGKLAATQTNKIATAGVAGFIERTAKSIAKAGATEAVTEAGQQVAERYAAGLPVSSADATKEYVNAAVTAFALGGVLGAAGGIRRTPAVDKAPEDVTNDDIAQHVELVLTGANRVPPLALPAPEPLELTEQAPLQITAREGAAEPLALPSPEMLGRAPQGPEVGTDGSVIPGENPVDFHVDSAGRAAAPALVDPVTLANTPVDNAPAPTFQEQLVETKKGLRGSWVTKLEAENEADLVSKVHKRIFEDQDEASSVQKLAQRVGLLDEALNPTPLAQEIEAQKVAALQQSAVPEVSPIEITPAPAPTQPLGGSGGLTEPTQAPPVTQEVASAGVGIEPITPEIRSVEPSPEITAPPQAPAAPDVAHITPQTDADFAQTWAQIRKEAGVDRASPVLRSPANLTDARRQVFEMLADDKVSRPGAESSTLEKLARKMGLVTDDTYMDYTPVARQTYLETPAGQTEVTRAAGLQGYTSPEQATLFDRGVRTVMGGQEETNFATPDARVAYNAGKVWAQDFVQNGDVATAAQSERIMGRKSENRPDGRAGIDRTQMTPAQIAQKAQRDFLDSVDLSGIPDQTVVDLRRQIAQGVSTDALARSIEAAQKAPGRFQEAPRREFKATPQKPGRRAQPIFKEMKRDAATVRTLDARQGTASKADARIETDAAVHAYDLRSLIELARTEGGITDVRASKFHDLLDQGKVDQVSNLLKAFDPDAAPQARAPRLPTPPETVFEKGDKGLLTGNPDAQFEAALEGKDIDGVFDHLIKTAPSKYMREIMKRVQSLATRMRKEGIELEFRIVRPGDTVPAMLNSPTLRALTSSTLNPPRSIVYMKSSAMGGSSGMNYQLAAHELIHAVTARLVHWGSRAKNADTTLGKDVGDLYDLFNAVIGHFNARAAEGNLNDFEQLYFQRDNNTLANPDELLAWGLTNPDMQRYLQSIEYAPRQSVFAKFVDLLRKLLGLEGSYSTALTELLRVSERINKAGTSELRSAFAMNNPEGLDTAVLETPAMEAAPRDAAGVNDLAKAAMTKLGEFAEKIDVRGFGAQMRPKILGFVSHNAIDRHYGQYGTTAHSDAHRWRVALRSRFEQMGEAAIQQFEQVEKASANAAKWVNQLMDMTTVHQIDPDKEFNEHTHLGFEYDKEAKVRTIPEGMEAEIAKLERLHGEIVALANNLKRGDGLGWQAFQDFRANNEAMNYARLATNLYELIAGDPELSLGVASDWHDPADAFMRDNTIEGAAAARDWWEKVLDDNVAAATAFVRATKGELQHKSKSEARAGRERLSPIELQIGAISQAKASMARAPYFHLGRFGEHFGSAVIRKGADGDVDPAALAHVAKALEEAGFADAQIGTDNTKPKIMLRFEKQSQGTMFRNLMLQLEQQGWLEKGEKIYAGPRTLEENMVARGDLPAQIKSLIQNVETAPRFQPSEGMSAKDKGALEQKKQETVQALVDAWLEAQPANSLAKVLTKRYTVAGYNKDMTRNWAHRWRVGSIALANVASSPRFDKAFLGMKAKYEQAKIVNQRDAEGNLLASQDPYVVHDLINELKARDARVPLNETADTFDKMRAVSHSYFLGFSPAYAAINLTQLGVTALPELAKAHGYRKAFAAMRKATPQALAILKAVAAEGKRLGWKHWGDIAITEQVLKNAGLSDQDRGFITHMLATGTIDIGSMARGLAQIADDKGAGGGLETYLRLSSGLGLYSETLSRLVTALSARHLHGGYGADAQAFAAKTVSESMFDYQTWNTARQLGKKGMLGPVTPIVTQFMSYSTQLTEKLYSEFRDAVGSDPAKRKEAQRFLAGHLTAVTTLAGTLGLPFATAFAGALERLVDGFDDDDEPFDATAAYRNWLASVIGQDAAEVVARGAPRALGFDISQRTGEQNLFPSVLVNMLTDRRSWKDAASFQLSAGAVPSMATQVLDGGMQIADGNIAAGMKSILPTWLKAPTEVYRMAGEGYVDTKGNRLPMTPKASAYLWQLMGFSPAEKAEYGEARGDQSARRATLSKQAGALRRQIGDAILDKDHATARELLERAIQFDKDNPGFAMVSSIGPSLQRRMQERARSQALGTPLGVSMKDIAGQQLTGYANF